ncbi:hypothetical protein [Hymenobacter sp. DG25A]|uniref:hypothetical protein n=1 Tax=Hymenobacter sp. DG25A TaxID=1385663 RepID=UPI0012F84BAF|nr:hypothetical protein [Hymenobacter sp. DG25A]
MRILPIDFARIVAPMQFFSSLKVGQFLSLLVLACALMLGTGCHRYRIPSPKGPPQPKVKLGKAGKNGTGMSAAVAELKTPKKSFDKQGLLKQKKYERRKLKHKVGQRKFMGIVF